MPETQRHRVISLASIVAMLLIPAIGWFLIAQPQLAAAAAADEQRASADALAESSRAAVAKLKADSENLDALNAELDTLRRSIPAGVDSSSYIDGLNALAVASGVTITSLNVDEATPYVSAAPPVAAAPPAGSGTATETPAPSDSPSAAATPAPVADPAIVTNSLITPESFVTIPVSIDVAGGWAATLGFIQGLQHGDRLFLVSKVSIDNSQATSTIDGFIYAIPGGVEGEPAPVSVTIKKMDVPASVAAETPTPHPTSSATPSPTGSGTPKP